MSAAAPAAPTNADVLKAIDTLKAAGAEDYKQGRSIVLVLVVPE